MRKPALITATLLVALGTVSLTTPSATASGDSRVERSGSCSGSAHWKLKAKPDDGLLEVEAEVDSNRSGQVWTWKIKRDGKKVASGTARTTGRSGSFSIERKIGDGAGADNIAFVANRQSGETCRGSVTL